MRLELQTVVDIQYYILINYKFLSLDDKNKIFIIKDLILEIDINSVLNYLTIYINCQYKNNNKNKSETNLFSDFYIRKILNNRYYIVRSVRRLHQTREELEIDYFDRNYIKKYFIFLIFLLYLLFIDNFDIYRNIYRALKAFYLIPEYLFYNKRRKTINCFVLILKSHRTNIENVIKVFAKSIKDTNRDVKITINKKIKLICACIITFLRDLSQQIDIAKFLRYSAIIKC